ncbi:MAG: single-stranded DNA-binding protein [Sphaerochaetaceae bacterium]|jgi:single-strand DNA-binding protein|nr:single-stranded DNA-binding protein [Sphaerochaetaceae bacterium]
MATDINSVVLIGRLTRESELKSTSAGTAVCRFSIAVNRVKGSADKRETEVSYIDIVVWGKQAEIINPYLGKGRQVCIQGELRQNRWEQDGQAKSKLEVVANSVQLLGTREGAAAPAREAQASSYNSRPANEPRNAAQQADFSGPESFDQDEIPF